MNTISRLAAHSVAFAMLAVALRPSTAEPLALSCVFIVGSTFLLLAPRHPRYSKSPRTWSAVFFYALLLAAIFAGADSAMAVLGNSIKPRVTLPSAFGGLELYWLLVFGVACVALGALVGVAVERLGHVRANHTSRMSRGR